MGEPTQEQVVLELLKEAGNFGLTPIEALKPVDLGGAACFRLAAVVHRLKKDLPPDKEIVNVGHTTRNGKHVACYVLRDRVYRGSIQTALFADL